MTKQLQDAYIVAATRTPIGKAPRGMRRHTPPDDVPVNVTGSALANPVASSVRKKNFFMSVLLSCREKDLLLGCPDQPCPRLRPHLVVV